MEELLDTTKLTEHVIKRLGFTYNYSDGHSYSKGSLFIRIGKWNQIQVGKEWVTCNTVGDFKKIELGVLKQMTDDKPSNGCEARAAFFDEEVHVEEGRWVKLSDIEEYKP